MGDTVQSILDQCHQELEKLLAIKSQILWTQGLITYKERLSGLTSLERTQYYTYVVNLAKEMPITSDAFNILPSRIKQKVFNSVSKRKIDLIDHKERVKSAQARRRKLESIESDLEDISHLVNIREEDLDSTDAFDTLFNSTEDVDDLDIDKLYLMLTCNLI
jgi:hypothetical protein